MKNKITVCEYLNYVNHQGECIGHGKKVFHEAIKILEEDFEITAISSESYALPVCQNSIRNLDSVDQEKMRSTNKIVFRNIFRAFKNINDKVIWFTNIDWRLLVCLAFMRGKRKIIITCYRDLIKDVYQSSSKIKHLKCLLMKKGMKRVDLVIVTNPNLKIAENQIFIPDYCYDEKYLKYDTRKKKERVLCIGAMRASKDLKGVVLHFRKTDIPVYIVGYFKDISEYEWIVENKTDNITIENRFLDDDEYYRLIAQSRYVIVPYKMQNYQNATSGILQECVFLEAIPIGPRKLLEYNGIDGVKYEKIDELPKRYAELSSSSRYVTQMKKYYDISIIKKKLSIAVKKLM